jgi:hypothetical protein
MATTTENQKTTLGLRLPRALRVQVRTIAEQEGETMSTIVRRYLKRGLDAERRQQEAMASESGATR